MSVDHVVDYASTADAYAASRRARMQGQYAGQTYATTGSNQALLQMNNGATDVMSLDHTDGCTDGKDDGKIGFGQALWNCVKGVGKSIVNGVKGMFTDSQGNFSLGKTILSVGLAAVCIAFPAVGFAACCVGVLSGAVQMGKGIYKAATAETDAEAKSAWQNVGAGTFTAVSSAVGAKASFGAMKATSTAGLGQVDDAMGALENFDKADDLAGVMTQIKGHGDQKAIMDTLANLDDGSEAFANLTSAVGKLNRDANGHILTSAWDNLGSLDDMSRLGKVGSYGKALLTDMGSSTKNQATLLLGMGREIHANNKTYTEAKAKSDAANDYIEARSQLDQATMDGMDPNSRQYKSLEKAVTKAEKRLGDLDMTPEYAQENFAGLQEATDAAQQASVRGKVDGYVEGRRETRLHEAEVRKEYKGVDLESELQSAQTRATEAQGRVDSFTENFTPEHGGQKWYDETLGYLQRDAEVAQTHLETLQEADSIINRKPFQHVTEILSEVKKGGSKFEFVKSRMSDQQKAIWEFLTTENGSYAEAVQQFGYTNVLGVLEVAESFALVNQTI